MKNEQAGWDDVYTWLTGKPDEWGQVIALRSALRVLPLVIDPPKWRGNKVDPAFVLPIFRYLVISSSTIQHSADTTLKIALFDEAWRFQKAYSRFNEHESAPDNVEFAAGDIVACAADAALSTAHAFKSLGGRGQNEHAEDSFARVIADGSRFAARAAEYAEKASSDIWLFVDQERAVLEDKVRPAKIANGKIWQAAPKWFQESWGRASQWLSRPQDGFAIWREWYYGRLEGLPHAFADFDDAADEKFYRWIIEQDNDWWSREPREVNADIKAFVDRLRKPPEPDNESEPPTDATAKIAQVLADTSSPALTWVDGKLSLVTREAFASQKTTDRETLKRRLLEAAKFLENCANDNAPRNLGGSFFSYHRHLETNWDRPDPETLDIYASVVGTLRKNNEYEDWADGIAEATDKFLSNHRAFITGTPGIVEQKEERAQIAPRPDADFAEAVGRFQIEARSVIDGLDNSGLARDAVMAHLNNQLQLVADMHFGPQPEESLDEFFDLPDGWTPQTRALGNIGGTFVSLRQNIVEGATIASLGATTPFQNLANELPKIDQIISLITSLFR